MYKAWAAVEYRRGEQGQEQEREPTPQAWAKLSGVWAKGEEDAQPLAPGPSQGVVDPSPCCRALPTIKSDRLGAWAEPEPGLSRGRQVWGCAGGPPGRLHASPLTWVHV